MDLSMCEADGFEVRAHSRMVIVKDLAGIPMPIGAHDHLDELYRKQNLLLEEAARLESARDLLDPDGPEANRHYILELEISALREESTRIASRISDVLERDLQR